MQGAIGKGDRRVVFTVSFQPAARKKTVGVDSTQEI